VFLGSWNSASQSLLTKMRKRTNLSNQTSSSSQNGQREEKPLKPFPYYRLIRCRVNNKIKLLINNKAQAGNPMTSSVLAFIDLPCICTLCADLSFRCFSNSLFLLPRLSTPRGHMLEFTYTSRQCESIAVRPQTIHASRGWFLARTVQVKWVSGKAKACKDRERIKVDGKLLKS